MGRNLIVILLFIGIVLIGRELIGKYNPSPPTYDESTRGEISISTQNTFNKVVRIVNNSNNATLYTTALQSRDVYTHPRNNDLHDRWELKSTDNGKSYMIQNLSTKRYLCLDDTTKNPRIFTCEINDRLPKNWH
jgi:hypothetical protein